MAHTMLMRLQWTPATTSASRYVARGTCPIQSNMRFASCLSAVLGSRDAKARLGGGWGALLGRIINYDAVHSSIGTPPAGPGFPWLGCLIIFFGSPCAI